jgi:hypothetical protein
MKSSIAFGTVLDGQNNKIKVAQAFLFIFMPSYAEISFWGPTKSLNRDQNIFLQIFNYGYKKISNSPLISRWGSFIFAASS